MFVKVNGETQAIEKETLTIAELLVRNKVQAPEMVSVQRNGEFVERHEYPTTALAENDEIDFLYFMGGGVGQ
jgi:sulfur carrier protein